MGIDSVQGYHLGRPMPSDRIDRWVREWIAADHASTAPVQLPEETR